MEAIFSPEQPDGDDGWYSSNITVTPPEGHSISIDGGKTWSTERIVFDEYDGDFEYLLRSDKEDDTKGAVARNTKHLKIDTTVPLIGGIEDGKTYCLETKFQATDKNRKCNGKRSDLYRLMMVSIFAAGKYDIIASDFAGNSITVSVTVNAEHTFGDWNVTKDETATEKGVKERICSVCGYKETADVPAMGVPEEPSTPESPDNPVHTNALELAIAAILRHGLL